MKVLFDTDLASAFAKVGRMELLARLFAGIDLSIAFEVHKELLVALEHGYRFPSQEEVRALIQELWEKDKLTIVAPDEIFQE